ncbi:hypothetical protein L1987_10678 [Smallanthus sonchifolius]|uniref:Uncharacterized protein n=1 Tax=Smallanthus sonchifolius TaxID=185202 RepID=A0ACB9J8T4_9ASTR|nr:hypothetical protein L1987_10678 [Smallanthus sonchifolius]
MWIVWSGPVGPGEIQMEDWSKYSHSPAHFAVVRNDHAALKNIISTLPRLAKAGDATTEAESVAAELDAGAVSAVIDRRDVPFRETPLHLAVRLKDPVSAEILMAAGADWSLQNENGWSALQEAVCTREETIAMIIARYYQPSVIPFISRIAPSDTYKIWKRGSNLRADMTLAGFDGFRIQRSDQTFLFLGDGYEDGKVSLPSGSLIVLSHKEKEITNALEGAGVQPSETEVAREVALMSQTNMYRPGIDVTQAELVPHLNWRRMERTEVVGLWKSKVFDMLNVMVSVKSRQVPGAVTDEELFSTNDERVVGQDEYDDVLTAEEKIQLDSALKMENQDEICDDQEHGVHENGNVGSSANKDKKGWFGWKQKGSKTEGNDHEDSMILKKFSKLNGSQTSTSEIQMDDNGEGKKGKDKSSKKKKKKGSTTDVKHESEYKKGLRPVLWLTPDFPLKTEELLPLLDILANKVKAIRRLRELLTTKLPQGMFPVKIAIPIVPTIRVLVTFTKFEELQSSSEEFLTPLSSPAHFQDSKSKEPDGSVGFMDLMDERKPWSEKKRRTKAKKAKIKKHKKQSAARNLENGGGQKLNEDLE